MDDERFFDDDREEREDLPQQAQDNRPYDEEEDATQLETLLDFLTQALTQSSAVPLSNKRMVNVDMCLDIVDNIRECLPASVQYCKQILDNRDRVMRDAHAAAEAKVKAADARANSAIDNATKRAQELVNEAEDRAREIIGDAQNRARAMVEQSEIMRHAHEEAAQLCNDARADANEQRMEAARYAEDLLRELERDVQATLDAVRRSRKNISGE